ncbi:MAG: peptide chain release factor N(5)-glutamine methyltransferase [Lachnospiraceae bacterium]|jgi:release factor-specific protein-(glutamine-N5) methyltransferase|nr:peptide chain release factor N(5)-glutamine methyltransferase [Lachnospiraceae bacterium]
MRNSGIGGQAVLDGIMMRNSNRLAIAVRKEDGEIALKEEKIGEELDKKNIKNLPFIRGVFAFIDSLVVGIKTLNSSADMLEDENIEKEVTSWKDKAVTYGIIGISFIFAIGIFMILPYVLMIFLKPIVKSYEVRTVIEGIVRIGIFLLYVFLVGKISDIKKTYMYHGAEHKCINCIEDGKLLVVENVRTSSRFHKRCGTSFLFFVILIGIILLLLIPVKTFWLRILVRILILPFVASFSYELLKLAGRSDNKIINLLSAPGLAVQRITTSEPTDDMIEVAIAAVEAVFDWKKWQSKQDIEEEMPMEEVLRAGAMTLKDAGDAEPSVDAWLLLTYVMDSYDNPNTKIIKQDNIDFANRDVDFYEKESMGKNRYYPENKISNKKYFTKALYYSNPKKLMTPYQILAFKEEIIKRSSGIPVQHITGETEFCGFTFKVSKDVLIPRPETEVLVSKTLGIIGEHFERPLNIDILDMCTGSGCILISLMKLLDSGLSGSDISRIHGVGVDISSAALQIANKNKANLISSSNEYASNTSEKLINVDFIQSDLFANVRGKYDVIVSNPPYIKSAEVDGLDEIVKDHDPRLALDGHSDGLYFYNKIIEEVKNYLKDYSFLIFEIGFDQGDAVAGLMKKAGFTEIKIIPDLAGLDRVVMGKYDITNKSLNNEMTIDKGTKNDL